MNRSAVEAEIVDEKRKVEEKYGPWTAHNFSLGEGVSTINDEIAGDEVKLRRVVQIVADICDRPLGDLRILDLACLEGMYGIEFCRQGAQVCAIEGREANIEKARFAARVLGLDKIEFNQDDVRNLTVEKYGTFDVVLCLGILYHLDAPDIFTFLENIFAVCQRVAVIDTAISLYPWQTFANNGRTYWGQTVREHSPSASVEEKRKNLWASIDNPVSAYLTRVSLCSLLYNVGFTSVYECYIPQEPQKPEERVSLIAIKGSVNAPVGCPQLPPNYARDFPKEGAGGNLRQAVKIVGRVLPGGLRRQVRKLLFQ